MKQRLDEAGIEYAANANVAQLLQLYDQIPEEIRRNYEADAGDANRNDAGADEDANR